MQALVTGRGLGDPEMLMDGQDSVLTRYANPDLEAPQQPVPAKRPVPVRAPAKRVTRPPARETVGSRLMTRSVAAPRPASAPKPASPKPASPAPANPPAPAKPGEVATKAAISQKKRPAQTAPAPRAPQVKPTHGPEPRKRAASTHAHPPVKQKPSPSAPAKPAAPGANEAHSHPAQKAKRREKLP
jgi:hypothetical protein